MPGRHQVRRRLALRWVAGALGVGIVGAAAGTALIAGPANAAPTPNPTYHAGLDTATFSATGVLDSNCVVSTGGTEVWIKPGDKINFNSALAGLDLAGLGLTTNQIAGLNVDAVIDGKTTHPQTVLVRGSKVTTFPNTAARQVALAAGNHTLAWTAKSITLLPGLLGAVLPPVPLSGSALKSGAALSWTGVIHVTNDAAQCKLSVGTPQVAVSVGPVQVTVPPINVNVPVPNLPISIPKLPVGGGAGGGAGGGGAGGGAGGGVFTPNGPSVPEVAMGRIGAGGGFGNVSPDSGSNTRLGNAGPVPAGANPAAPKADTKALSKTQVITKRLDLAANRAPAAQLPVLLAIIAIIALSLVTATYARLFLLRRNA